jgi:hypothetical protein
MRGRANHISAVFIQRRSREESDDCFHGLRDAPSVSEIGPRRWSSGGKRVDKSLRLDRFEIIEPDVVSRDWDKAE